MQHHNPQTFITSRHTTQTTVNEIKTYFIDETVNPLDKVVVSKYGFQLTDKLVYGTTSYF